MIQFKAGRDGHGTFPSLPWRAVVTRGNSFRPQQLLGSAAYVGARMGSCDLFDISEGFRRAEPTCGCYGLGNLGVVVIQLIEDPKGICVAMGQSQNDKRAYGIPA